MLRRFDEFDPKSGTLSAAGQEVFGDVVDHARQILAHRSRKEIDHALETINGVLKRAEDESHAKAESAMRDSSLNPHEVACAIQAALLTSPLSAPEKALREVVGTLNIDADPSFPNAAWQEYFAVLALGIVWTYLELEEYPPKTASLSAQWAEPALWAKNALAEGQSVADALARKQGLVPRTELLETFRLAGKRGGNRRHAKTRQTKRAFLQYYDREYLPHVKPGKKPIPTRAARAFYETYLRDKPDLLQDPEGAYRHWDNVRRLCLNALRERKDGKL